MGPTDTRKGAAVSRGPVSYLPEDKSRRWTVAGHLAPLNHETSKTLVKIANAMLCFPQHRESRKKKTQEAESRRWGCGLGEGRGRAGGRGLGKGARVYWDAVQFGQRTTVWGLTEGTDRGMAHDSVSGLTPLDCALKTG